MAKIAVYVLYCFYFFCIRHIEADFLKTGDVCFDGRSICTSLAECPSARHEIQKGLFPALCAIENYVVLICCSQPRNSGKLVSTSTTPSDHDDDVKFIERRRVSVATKKCNEYMAYACGSHSSGEINPIIKPGIVGGEESRPQQFPHMALIGYGYRRNYITWACGGSLISERYILSAAHCAQTTLGDARWAHLGDLDMDSSADDADPQNFLIISHTVHPEYKPPSVYNDIVLFKMNRNVRFSDYIRPLCLHETPDIPHKELIAAGWGATGYGTCENVPSWYEGNGEITSNKMMHVNLSLIDYRVCIPLYPSDEYLPNGVDQDKQLCAGYLDGGKDTCQGDSGGPLHYLNVQTTCPLLYKQVGIVSFGKGCAFKNSPGIYTKISYYVPWIEGIVWT